MRNADYNGPRSVYANDGEELLTLRTSPPQERADAARNRAAVLEAAARLFGTHGVAAVSMDAVAAAAGVGKGTLFRRFGEKAGLAAALLDHRERELQEAILFGPAPLGPGAAPAEVGSAAPGPGATVSESGATVSESGTVSELGAASSFGASSSPTPGERLLAFAAAYLDYALEHLDLVRMSETASPGARYRIGAYRFWHRHVALLLAAARPEDDADALAHALLAAMSAEHLHAVVAEEGPERVRRATLLAVSGFVRQ